VSPVVKQKTWSLRKSLDLGLERQGLGLEQQGLGLDKKVLVTALVATALYVPSPVFPKRQHRFGDI